MARVKLNLKGLEEQAKTPEFHRAINEAAEAVADNVRGQGIKVEGGKADLPVEVYGDRTTDDMRVNRAQAYVTLAHAAGLAVQAKRGALTKAASAAGLTVKEKR